MNNAIWKWTNKLPLWRTEYFVEITNNQKTNKSRAIGEYRISQYISNNVQQVYVNTIAVWNVKTIIEDSQVQNREYVRL